MPALAPAPRWLWGSYLLFSDPAGRPRILLIEDDPTIAQMYRLQLELEEFAVVVAADGPTGLRAARLRPPELILLDLRLPGMTGLEVLTELKSEAATAATPVVVLSNYSDPSMVAQAIQLGATDYLVKSTTTPLDLAARVRALLSRD
ncbi:MAG TPA: response regulator transcription factor [Candidatus Dormibacteraeota bacterium]